MAIDHRKINRPLGVLDSLDGELHPAATSKSGIALLLVMVGGVGSQHLANERGIEFAHSRLIPLLDTALDMYAAYVNPDRPANWKP